MVSLQIVKRCMTHAGDVPDLRLTGEDEPEDGASAETEQILANVRPVPLGYRSSVWTSCAALLLSPYDPFPGLGSSPSALLRAPVNHL